MNRIYDSNVWPLAAVAIAGLVLAARELVRAASERELRMSEWTKEIRERRLMTFCSFADDDANHGIVILDGYLTAAQAVENASRLGVNPGGECMAVKVPTALAFLSDAQYAAHWHNRNRVMSGEEACKLIPLVKDPNAGLLPHCDFFDQGNPS